MARDIIHHAVKNALIKEGWTITHDPLSLEYEDATLFVDLGAERVIAAERQGEKIAVEIKSFTGPSAMHEVEVAFGQYMVYLGLLEVIEADRKLYLAISYSVYETIFGRKSIKLLRKRFQIPLIVVNVIDEELIRWIN
jgi:hypothetical protein